MYEPELEDFLAHYGVKGMKWGVRRKSGSSRSGSKSESGSEKPKRKIDKKKVAIAAGIIGATAAITIGAVVVSKQHSAGKASVMDQMKKMGGESTWDVLTKVPTTPKPAPKPTKPTRAELDARVDALKKKAGEDAVRQQIKDFSKQSMWDIMTDDPKPTKAPPSTPAPKKSGIKTPAQKRREGEEAAKEQIKAFASKSMWDIAADTSMQPAKKSSYSDRAKKSDTKLYGAKGASQIKKQVDRGIPLSEARQKAAVKTYGGTAARVAANVGTAKARESAKTKIDRAKKRR